MKPADWTERIGKTVGYAVRALRRSPGFTLGTVLTLGLGIGVNATMFTFLDRVLVRPPPGVEKPDDVRRLYVATNLHDKGVTPSVSGTLRYPQLRAIAARLESSGPVGIFTSFRDSVDIRAGNEVFPARRTLANSAYFQVLRVRPLIGRLFSGDQDRIDHSSAVVILSHNLWVNAFAGRADVVGLKIRVNGRASTIVGVAPDHFAGVDLDRSDFWMPIGNYLVDATGKIPWYETAESAFQAIIRTDHAPDADRSLDVAATEAIRGIRIPDVSFDSSERIVVGPLLSAAGPGTKPGEVSVGIRLGLMSVLILFITMANVANLLLVRSTTRAHEIAIRRALGVSRLRLTEQLLIESLILSLLSAGVAVLLGSWAGNALRVMLLPGVSWPTPAMEWRGIAFTVSVAIAAGFVIGLVPAVHAWRKDIVNTLRGGAHGISQRRSLARSGLLVAQTALSLLVLVGAALFAWSFSNAQNVDLGYDERRTLIVLPRSDSSRYGDALHDAMPALVSRFAATEGVTGVAAASSAPMMREDRVSAFLPDHDSVPTIGGRRTVGLVNVTPSYFRVVGMSVIAGEAFAETRRDGIVVSEAVAHAYWPGQSAIGRCLTLRVGTRPCQQVIGVVGNVHRATLVEEPDARVYVSDPNAQYDALLLRVDGQRSEVTRVVTSEVMRLVPKTQVVQVGSIPEMIERQLRPWRLSATLFEALGTLALVVAAIGVYSVVTYSMSLRTAEMGIRIALGAKLPHVTRLIVEDGLRSVLVGIVVGVCLAAAIARFVDVKLFGLTARDPRALLVAAVPICGVALLACIVPALRAWQLDPAISLKAE